jgi:hypothetical protein
MSNPTRFQNGLSNHAIGKPLANMPYPDATRTYINSNDFQFYRAGDWTVITGTNAGAAAPLAGQGGLATLTTAAVSAADYESLTDSTLDINFSSLQQVWFSSRVKLSVIPAPVFLTGLTDGATATLAPVNGMYFKKNATNSTVDFVMTKASVSTTLASVATLVAGTFIRLAFYYNGKDAVDVFVNDVKVTSQSTLTNLPIVSIGQTVGVVNGAAVATVATVDWLVSAQDRDAI